MRRRRVLAGVAALLVTSRESAAQQAAARIPRVGWIWNGRSAGTPTEAVGFRQGLKELGYVEGRSIVVDYRSSELRNDRLADLAAELVQLRPDVLRLAILARADEVIE